MSAPARKAYTVNPGPCEFCGRTFTVRSQYRVDPDPRQPGRRILRCRAAWPCTTFPLPVQPPLMNLVQGEGAR